MGSQYIRNGYFDANNSNSSIKSLTPSYKFRAEPDVNRPTTLTALIGGPVRNINPNTIPMGAFTQDYEYVEGQRFRSTMGGLE